MISFNKFLVLICAISFLSACSGGGGGGGGTGTVDSELSGDVLKNEAVLTKEPTQMSDFDNSFYTTFKAKFSTNYTDTITAAYPETLVQDYIDSSIIGKTAVCESNTFPGTTLSYSSNGFPTASIDASYSKCVVGSNEQTGSLSADTGTYVKQSYINSYTDNSTPNFAQETSKTYIIWEMRKTTNGTKATYTYRSREGYQKDLTAPLQYVAHWLTFDIDTATSPATVTAKGKVQFYLKDATDGDILKSYSINFTNLSHYTSGGNNCVLGTGKLTDGTNTQSGVYLGSSNPSAMGGGPSGMMICFSKVNL